MLEELHLLLTTLLYSFRRLLNYRTLHSPRTELATVRLEMCQLLGVTVRERGLPLPQLLVV